MAGLVLVLLASTVGLALAAPGISTRHLETLELCSGGASRPCLVEIRGRLEPPQGRSTWVFIADGPGRSEQQFNPRVLRGGSRDVTRGGEVVGLHLGDDLVGVRDPDGLVHWDGRGHWPLPLVVTSVALLLALAVTVVLLCRALDAATGEADRPR